MKQIFSDHRSIFIPNCFTIWKPHEASIEQENKQTRLAGIGVTFDSNFANCVAYVPWLFRRHDLQQVYTHKSWDAHVIYTCTSLFFVEGVTWKLQISRKETRREFSFDSLEFSSRNVKQYFTEILYLSDKSVTISFNFSFKINLQELSYPAVILKYSETI